MLKIINRELDEIIRHQEEQPKENPLFQDFEKTLAEKLKKHDEFMASMKK
ncbi:MAG: hypothetical protein DIU64_003185 [Caldicoprobacter oshimai]